MIFFLAFCFVDTLGNHLIFFRFAVGLLVISVWHCLLIRGKVQGDKGQACKQGRACKRGRAYRPGRGDKPALGGRELGPGGKEREPGGKGRERGGRPAWERGGKGLAWGDREPACKERAWGDMGQGGVQPCGVLERGGVQACRARTWAHPRI